MPRCVVIQPFDSDEFDKRYKEVLEPAIRAAGLEPYRVDQDAGASVPIKEVLKQIKESDTCLAEISTNNPNVWFEFGYAFSYHQEEVVIICSKSRLDNLPFDVQHLRVIPYEKHSRSDFDELEKETTARLEAILEKRKQRPRGARPLAPGGELLPSEAAALRVVAEHVDEPVGGIAPWDFHKKMARIGFSREDGNLALDSLPERGMLERFEDGWEEESFGAYRLTSEGASWLRENREEFWSNGDEIPF